MNSTPHLTPFGGSASVSYLLKKMGKTVTYNDNLKFNSTIGKALIENPGIKFTEEDIYSLYNHTLPSTSLIQEVFKGVYYMDEENAWLDGMSNGILNMNHYAGRTLEFKKSLAYYALFQASLIKRPYNLFHRNNLNIRTRNVKRNFGNKVTWEKDFSNCFRSFITEVNQLTFDSKKKCRSTNQSVFDISNTNFDLVYLDPPYLNSEGDNETANYLKCYHFLEGIVNYGDWLELIDYQTSNLRLKDSSSTFGFSKAEIYKSFENIIEKFSHSTIVLSYKKGGTPSIDFLVKLMKKHKKKVYTRSQHYIYALNRQNGNDKLNKEVLIIGI